MTRQAYTTGGGIEPSNNVNRKAAGDLAIGILLVIGGIMSRLTLNTKVFRNSPMPPGFFRCSLALLALLGDSRSAVTRNGAWPALKVVFRKKTSKTLSE